MALEQTRKIDIVHFNDAYELDIISRFVKKFRSYDDRNSIRLFSGDIFSPSIAANYFKGIVNNYVNQ